MCRRNELIAHLKIEQQIDLEVQVRMQYDDNNSQTVIVLIGITHTSM